MKTIAIDKPSGHLAAVFRAAFPAYRGRKWVVRIRESMRFSDTQWSGGTRSQYVAVKLSSPPQTVPVPEAPLLRRSAMHENDVDLVPGFVVVEHARFCGKDMGLRVHTCAGNIDHMLPMPEAELTDDEVTVLDHTAALKSSYGGAKNYRFVEANRRTGITLDRWDSAKASLIGQKLLNRAGAITAGGRNALALACEKARGSQ